MQMKHKMVVPKLCFKTRHHSCASKRCVGTMRVKDVLWAEQVKKLPWTKVKGTGKGPRQGGISEKRFHPHDHQHTKPWAGIMAWAPVLVSKWIQWVTDQRAGSSAPWQRRQMKDAENRNEGDQRWTGETKGNLKMNGERRCAGSCIERPSCMPLV